MFAFLRYAGWGLKYLIQNGRPLLYSIGLIAAGTISLKSLAEEAKDTAIGLWPLLALTFFFLLLREFIRGYFKAKEKNNKQA